jgi:hypothetical protein
MLIILFMGGYLTFKHVYEIRTFKGYLGIKHTSIHTQLFERILPFIGYFHSQ